MIDLLYYQFIQIQFTHYKSPGSAPGLSIFFAWFLNLSAVINYLVEISLSVSIKLSVDLSNLILIGEHISQLV